MRSVGGLSRNVFIKIKKNPFFLKKNISCQFKHGDMVCLCFPERRILSLLRSLSELSMPLRNLMLQLNWSVIKGKSSKLKGRKHQTSIWTNVNGFNQTRKTLSYCQGSCFWHFKNILKNTTALQKSTRAANT